MLWFNILGPLGLACGTCRALELAKGCEMLASRGTYQGHK